MNSVDLTITPSSGTAAMVGNIGILEAIDIAGMMDWTAPGSPPAWDMISAAAAGTAFKFNFGSYAYSMVKTAGKTTLPTVGIAITDSGSGKKVSLTGVEFDTALQTLGYLNWTSEAEIPAWNMLEATIAKKPFNFTMGTYQCQLTPATSGDGVGGVAIEIRDYDGID